MESRALWGVPVQVILGRKVPVTHMQMNPAGCKCNKRFLSTNPARVAFLLCVYATVSVFCRAQSLPVRNSSGVSIAIDSEDHDPALTLVVPDGPEHERSSKILFPEHVTVRARGKGEQTHLYTFRPGQKDDAPQWTETGNALQYESNFGDIHFAARATLVADGIVFRYEFTNHSTTDYEMATAVTDPRFRTTFYDPRLQRTYVHHKSVPRRPKSGFALLASETPTRLTMPLEAWFPVRYHASYTVPVPERRVQHRDDGITYYYNSELVDVPMIATLSEDRKWIAASFARNPGNVWTNPELTCQHVDPELKLAHGTRAAYEVKILIFEGSLDDALKKVLSQRKDLE